MSEPLGIDMPEFQLSEDRREYLLDDYLFPKLKDLMADAVTAPGGSK